MLSDLENNIEVFKNLIFCVNKLSYWKYDSEMNIVFSNSDERDLYDSFFEISGCKEYGHKYCLTNDKPLFLSDSIGLVWISIPEKNEGQLKNIHVIGPALTAEASEKNVEANMQKIKLPISSKLEFKKRFRSLPIIPSHHFMNYGIMLNYCINGLAINIYDMNYQLHLENNPVNNTLNESPHGTWMLEQTLLKLISEGNLNYREVINNLRLQAVVGKMSSGDPLRQDKNSAIVLTSLCTRAAVSGGLSSELAYTLSDYYIQGVEDCATIAEVNALSNTLLDDFIHRVHNHKYENNNCSKQITSCCDYIELHIKEKIEIEVLAKYTGYTNYYLTNKFKNETGYSINDYIKLRKIEYAKLLLTSTEQSIQEISASLSFCSQSFFGVTFNKLTGMSPSDYRKNVT